MHTNAEKMYQMTGISYGFIMTIIIMIIIIIIIINSEIFYLLFSYSILFLFFER